MSSSRVYALSLLAALFTLSGGLSDSPGAGLFLNYSALAQEEPEDEVEEDVEEEIEEDVEEDIEDDVEEDIEDDVESDIEDSIEDDVEEDVESDIEDDVESEIESEIEDSLESEIEDDVEAELEDSIEGEVEESLEEEIEDGLEDELESEVEEDVEEDAEDEVEDEVENEEEIEDDVEEEIDDRAGEEPEIEEEGPVETSAREKADEDENQTGGKEDGARVQAGGFERADLGEAAEIEIIDIERDQYGDEFIAAESVFIAEPSVVADLEARGYASFQTERLDGLDLVLIRVERHKDEDIDAAADRLSAEGVAAEFDANHVYRAQQSLIQGSSYPSAPEAFPASLFSLQHDSGHEPSAPPLRLGLIDSDLDLSHPALAGRHIVSSNLSENGNARPTRHGTAIASILVGRDRHFKGLLPEAELYAAGVFDTHPEAGEIATTASLVRAINWLVVNEVQVINMSLAGPPNRVVEAAINAAVGKGVVIVAAAGNDGPASQPLYPAAYENVIAVTAVDYHNRVYRLAVRGPHIDFAAPGVNVVAAEPEGAYGHESGTSVASPFVAALIAHLAAGPDGVAGGSSSLIETISAHALDLGEPGFDPIYGHGLIRP